MLVALGLIVFLVGLVIFTPFVDGTTDGLYDAESDDTVQADT